MPDAEHTEHAEHADRHEAVDTKRLDSRQISGRLLGAFYASYKLLGCGFPEALCANALAVELRRRGLAVRREVPVAVVYNGVPIGAFRIDMVVEEQIVVELKSTKVIHDADLRQLLNYLRLSTYEVGFLLHYGPRSSFKRMIYSNARKTL